MSGSQPFLSSLQGTWRSLAHRVALSLVLVAMAGGASAHTQSYGFLTAEIDTNAVAGRLELAIRDVDAALDLDQDLDGKVTWGEVRSREAELSAALLGQISVGTKAERCTLSSEPVLVDARGGESYLVVPFRGPCPTFDGLSEVGYRLLFDTDAQHRGLVAVTAEGVTRTFVARPDRSSATLDFRSGGNAGLFLSFVVHGAHHIWIGYDHVLFLLTLLLGTVLKRRSGIWVPTDSFGQALVAAAKVVTAFTIAHSLTLALAAFDVLILPVALTESIIAATITLAAINNVVPIVTARLWLVAFAFGLIHGVGFANVLAELDLPRQGLLSALLAFNLGVEFGQLAIVALVLPFLMLAGRRPAYRRIMPALSLAIAAVGVFWFLQRAFGLSLFPASALASIG
jgi:hypothetical protein